MNVTVPNDCDNAPKRRLIKDFVIAWYLGRSDEINSAIGDQFLFEEVNKTSIISKDDLRLYIDRQLPVRELTIDKILSHGKYAACNGHVEYEHGRTNFAFFMEFKSAGNSTIRSIMLYPIKST